jgi:hypothetical protein
MSDIMHNLFVPHKAHQDDACSGRRTWHHRDHHPLLYVPIHGLLFTTAWNRSTRSRRCMWLSRQGGGFLKRGKVSSSVKDSEANESRSPSPERIIVALYEAG